uniref:Uncharacterized protein n=1 Tax=Kalanchoe fedtschenkoi TaxID=63787 RepID=A0A7N0VDW8_KALFE
MHRVGSSGNTASSVRPRKEKRLTYVINHPDDKKHCAGVNCLAILKSHEPDTRDYLFTGSRDGTLKKWELTEDAASCSAVYESHVDWVNDVVVVGNGKFVSCSSDSTIKVWDCSSDGACTRTFRQHSDYVTRLAAERENRNIVASGGLGGEVFIWDIESSLRPISTSDNAPEDACSNPLNGSIQPGSNLRPVSSSSSISLLPPQSHGYVPTSLKGHKESVYALAMNDSGTVLVSGGTEKVIRVWDPRTGSKTMKLRGHSDNIRSLLVDPSGRYCLSGSSDSMIRLWDLGQQRCVHSYAVHTDSVWALASSQTFSHVYSGGRDLSLYLTDLTTRESVLLCTKEHPILQLELHDESIWVASTDSSVQRWTAEGSSPQKAFQSGTSFLAGNLSFSRTRVSLEGSTLVPLHKEPSLVIPGTPAIVQHEILNNKRHILTKDTSGSVKLWEVTRGIVIEDYGKVSFDEKKNELFEMVSIPSWFTVDTKFGNLSIHLDTPQCFSAEIYASDLKISEKAEDDKVNLARETLKGLLTHWLAKRKQKIGSRAASIAESPLGKDISSRSLTNSRIEVDGTVDSDSAVYPPFEFSTSTPPSIITEGSHGGPWRKKVTEFEGCEDEKDFPGWCLDCVLNNRLPTRENSKCSFCLQPCEGSPAPSVTLGKLSAPGVLRIHKVASYVLEKVVIDPPINQVDLDAPFSSSLSAREFQQSAVGIKPRQKLKPSVEILCNNEVLPSDMSLATVRAFKWKKPDDLVLNYRVMHGR